MNAAQHKIVNSHKTFFFFAHHACVFSMWPKTTPILPLWPREAKRLDTPEDDSQTLVIVVTF